MVTWRRGWFEGWLVSIGHCGDLVESSVAFPWHTVTVDHTLQCPPIIKVPRVAQAQVLVFCCTLRFMANWWLGHTAWLVTLPGPN